MLGLKNAQIKVSLFFFSAQVFPFLSAEGKKLHAPRSLCNMTELLPLLHLICKEIPLFSMSGLKHVYTSTVTGNNSQYTQF